MTRTKPRANEFEPPQTETQTLTQVLEAMLMFGVDVERTNTGGMLNAQGQYVRFGTPGTPDIGGQIVSGPARGKRIEVEVKRPGFDPRKVRGKKAQAHWARQLARLRKTNEGGGFALWVTSAGQVVHALQRINEGWRVDIDAEGFGWLTDELEPPTGSE